MSRLAFKFEKKLQPRQRISICDIEVSCVDDRLVWERFNLEAKLHDKVVLQHYGQARETSLFFIILGVSGLVILHCHDNTTFHAFSLGYMLEEQDFSVLEKFLARNTSKKKLARQLYPFAKDAFFCVNSLIENIVTIYISRGISQDAIEFLALGLESAGSDLRIKQAQQELQQARYAESRLKEVVDQAELEIEQLHQSNLKLNQQLRKLRSQSKSSLVQEEQTSYEVSTQFELLQKLQQKQEELVDVKQHYEEVRRLLQQKESEEEECWSKVDLLQSKCDSLKEQNQELLAMLHQERKKHDVLQQQNQEIQKLQFRCGELEQELVVQKQLFNEKMRLQHEQAQEHEMPSISLAAEFMQCEGLEGIVLDQEQKSQLLHQLLDLCQSLDLFCKLGKKELVDFRWEEDREEIVQARIRLNSEAWRDRSLPKRALNRVPKNFDDAEFKQEQQNMVDKRQQYAQWDLELTAKLSNCDRSFTQVLQDAREHREISAKDYIEMMEKFSELMHLQLAQIQKILAELFPKCANISRNLKCFFLLAGLEQFKESYPSLLPVLAELEQHFEFDKQAVDMEGQEALSPAFVEHLGKMGALVAAIDPVIQQAIIIPANQLQPLIAESITTLKQIITDLNWYHQYVSLREGINSSYAAEIIRCFEEVGAAIDQQQKQRLAEHKGDASNAATVTSVGKTEETMRVGAKLAGEEHAISPQLMAYEQFCRVLVCWHVVLACQVSVNGMQAHIDLESVRSVIHMFVQLQRPLLLKIYQEHYVDLAAVATPSAVTDLDAMQEKMQRSMELKAKLPAAFADAFKQQVLEPLMPGIHKSLETIGVFRRFPNELEQQLAEQCSSYGSSQV